jgi:hypothetical protein
VELVKIFRELWRRKFLVAAVLIVSLLVGSLLAFKPGLPPHSRQYEVSLSSADILVDTRDSQLATVNGHGPDLPTLAARANLIGNLMTGGPLKEAIAEQAGIPAEDLIVVPPPNPATPGVAAVPVGSPATAGLTDAESTILTLSTDESLPILHITSQAPNQEDARRLTEATIEELKNYVGGVATTQKIPAIRRLVVREFGAPVAETAVRGVPRSYAVGAFLALLMLGCGAIIGGSWFIRSWKQIAAEESHGAEVAANNGSGNGNGAPSDEDESEDGTPGSSPDLPRSAVLRFPL